MDIINGSKNGLWSEEQPIMKFFKDGDHLRIVADRLQGGTDEVFLSKDHAAQIVKFIQHNATTRKSGVIVP